MALGAAQGRDDLIRIFDAAIDAVEPCRLVRSYLRANRFGRCNRLDGRDPGEGVLVVGAGKAAARMAAGCEAALAPRRVGGLVIVPDGYEAELSGIEIAVAGHPIPDERGARATSRVCELLRGADAGPVLCLVSGGASSLLVRPRFPLTLAEKIETNRLLLRSGCAIDEINAVRKHLSDVKGGGLLRFCMSRPVVTLLLSDVIGDQPETIGSGPTVADSTTFLRAKEILDRFELMRKVPPSVREIISAGALGNVRESVKSGDSETDGTVATVIGSNRDALAGAARKAERLGYRPIVMATPVSGDTAVAARKWFASVRARLTESNDTPCCVIAGGETTVDVKGSGRGGRNCEFSLALADLLEAKRILVLSAGTDGIDGPTDAAGAFVGPDTQLRAERRGLDSINMLASNDSYTFFEALGDLFRPGPTGTNVMDLKLALSLPASRGVPPVGP
jgi:glycerate 2-kinase